MCGSAETSNSQRPVPLVLGSGSLSRHCRKMLSVSLARCAQYSVRKQRLTNAPRRRLFATFEEESSAPQPEVPPQFTPPASSPGDSQTLPLVQKGRSLLESRKSGTFTSVSLAPEDKHMPLFGSLMPYVLLPELPGQPIIALRTDEKHFDHIQQVDSELVTTILNKYEIVHPGSTKFLKDRDLFHFYAMEPQDVFYQLSTQEIDQFRGRDFCAAKVDPIAKDGRELVEDLNSKYASELKMLCREYGDVEVSEAMVIGVDRLGFDILGRVADSPNQWQEFRMPLDKSVEDIEEYRGFLEQACQEVRKVEHKRRINNPGSSL